MDLFEYQAKELFAEYGVPVPKNKVANTAEEARDITTAFAAEGIPQVVVKAQVKVGGRGKAGGVKLADGPGDAYEKAQRIIGMDIKGHTVHRVLSPRRPTSRPSTTCRSSLTGRTAPSCPSAPSRAA